MTKSRQIWEAITLWWYGCDTATETRRIWTGVTLVSLGIIAFTLWCWLQTHEVSVTVTRRG